MTIQEVRSNLQTQLEYILKIGQTGDTGYRHSECSRRVEISIDFLNKLETNDPKLMVAKDNALALLNESKKESFNCMKPENGFDVESFRNPTFNANLYLEPAKTALQKFLQH